MYASVDEVKKAYLENKNIEFLFFWGHHQSKDGTITKSCLSQWYKAHFTIDGIIYNCMEQYMMAEKARLFKDEDTLMAILNEQEPKKIKALGRKVKNYNDKEWRGLSRDIVKRGNLAKFGQNPRLKQYLLSTGDKVIVEASPYDQIWGIGMSAQYPEAKDPNQWLGTNYLGFALEWVREQLKTQ